MKCHNQRSTRQVQDVTSDVNLLGFLYEMSTRTKSMLLATATPVQLRPVEAWDLLDVLARGSEAVLGGAWSNLMSRRFVSTTSGGW